MDESRRPTGECFWNWGPLHPDFRCATPRSIVHSRALLLFAAAAGLSAADYAAEGKLWWSHIQFLADDALEGRAVGRAGYLKAVQYVETQFDKLGLQPAGTKGFLQPVRFETRQITESSIELIVDGNADPVVAGEAALSSRGDVQPLVEAPMVFVGYGM